MNRINPSNKRVISSIELQNNIDWRSNYLIELRHMIITSTISDLTVSSRVEIIEYS
jgi:hypothetical protein